MPSVEVGRVASHEKEPIHRVATVREKYLENEIFFQVREKSGNFVDGQGNLERTWKVRKFENKWL